MMKEPQHSYEVVKAIVESVNKPVTVKMAPAPDFTYTGIVITHGYNLDGPEFVRDNRQYQSVTIQAASFNKTTHEYTIPAAYIDGEVRIEGLFTPGELPDPEEQETYTVTYKKNVTGTFYQGGSEVTTGKGWAAAEWVSAEPEPIVTIQGGGNNGFNTTNFNIARDRTITISVSGDYLITGYKIYTPAGWGATIVAEGGESAVFSGEQTLTISGLSTKSTYFTTADANLNDPTIDIYIVNTGIPVGVEGIKDIASPELSVYTIDGRRLTKPIKGLNIINGKKVSIK